jgi:fatty-acyl-CoA synthase
MSNAADRSYRAETQAEFKDWSVSDLLHSAVVEAPDRLALISPAGAQNSVERRWTYRELEDQVQRAARALLLRFEPGDRVATWAAASPDIVLLQLGAAIAGIVLVTLNPANRSVEMSYLLAQSEVRGIFLDRIFRKVDNAATLDSLRPALPNLKEVIYLDEWTRFLATAGQCSLPQVSPSAAAMIVFTSGTTGRPKGVVLHHAGIVNNARFSAARIAAAADSVWLNVLPMFHIGGSVTMTLGCIADVGTQVLLPEFSAAAMLDALQRYQVTVTMAVPTMFFAMFQDERFDAIDFSSLEVIVTGGTVVAPELVREVRQRFGAEVMVLFGQTEAGGCMCLTRRGDEEERITHTVGTPLPLSEVKIVPTGSGGMDAVGQVGEICVRTRCAMSGYFRLPDKTAETIDSEGWVHTGDLGRVRDDGYLQITGRLKDMIIRGGENIYPREIEDVLAEHPSVGQAAVFGVADTTWGEQVAAAVILRPGVITNIDALTLFLQERIARHKVPKIWHFVESLPVNASGKVQKYLLRERHQNPEDA